MQKMLGLQSDVVNALADETVAEAVYKIATQDSVVRGDYALRIA